MDNLEDIKKLSGQVADNIVGAAMKESKEMSDEDVDYFVELLKVIRDSGAMNMFGAPAYLQKEFNLSKEDAMKVFSAYKDSFNVDEAFAWDDIDEARKERPDDDDDDWDDDDDEEAPEDPEKDKTPHILMQLRKAKDVEGNYEIKFADGSKSKLPLKDIDAFMDMYMMVKPLDREKMQQVAIMSKNNFDKIVSFFKPKHGRAEKSIYDRR